MMLFIMTMVVIVLAATGVLGVVYTMHHGAHSPRARAELRHRPPSHDAAEGDGERADTRPPD